MLMGATGATGTPCLVTIHYILSVAKATPDIWSGSELSRNGREIFFLATTKYCSWEIENTEKSSAQVSLIP